jgi:cell pole-organizing protein PopZ
MSGSNSNTPPGANGGDPSMEDILASIRRILAEDEPAADAAPAAPTAAPAPSSKPAPAKDDVLVLDSSMLAPATPASAPATAAAPAAQATPAPSGANGARNGAAAPAPTAAAPPAKEAVNGSGGTHGADTGQPLVIRNNLPCFEDAVRDAMRPFIQQWLDAALPKLVERLVRTEVERVVGGSVQ